VNARTRADDRAETTFRVHIDGVLAEAPIGTLVIAGTSPRSATTSPCGRDV